MDVQILTEILGSDFYTGVPDIQLKALCDYLMDKYGIDPKHHIIAANEGNCTGLAAGYHLATGRIPVVYLQNSGEGNIVNPVASLLNDNVYAIPCIFIIGWRGEPGMNDEKQHICQGKMTIKLLKYLDIKSYIIGPETTEEELRKKMDKFKSILNAGKSIAFIIRKGTFSYSKNMKYSNNYTMFREEVIEHIVKISGEDILLSTTGRTSRELFEIREIKSQSHKYDFLSVGGMGHNSSIALGIAINKPESKVWCIDGDGSALMHMGSMAVLGKHRPRNIIHIVINNGAHETVGGLPTVASEINFIEIAKGCGYPYTVCVESFKQLDIELMGAKKRNNLSFIEIKCFNGRKTLLRRLMTDSRRDKDIFMEYLNTLV